MNRQCEAITRRGLRCRRVGYTMGVNDPTMCREHHYMRVRTQQQPQPPTGGARVMLPMQLMQIIAPSYAIDYRCECEMCKARETAQIEKERDEIESYVPNPNIKLKVVHPVECELCLCDVPKLTTMCCNNHQACKRCITKFRTTLCPFCRSELTLPQSTMSIINENVSKEIRERDAEAFQMLQNEYGRFEGNAFDILQALLMMNEQIMTPPV
jgi:hypothetical protein